MNASDNQKDMNFKKLTFLLEKLNLEFPIADLSRKTGYSEGTISPYVNGKIKPSSKFLQTIIDKFDVNLDGFEDLNYKQPNVLSIISEPTEDYGLKKENLELKKEIQFKDEQIVFYKDKIEFLENKIYDLELGHQKKQNGTS